MNAKSLVVSIASALTLFSAPALAHGGQVHVLGTVKAVQADTLTVETPKHTEVTVKLSPDTHFEKGKAAATAKDLAVGERVVVHTRKDGDALTAVEVHIGAAEHAHHDHHDHAASAPSGEGKSR